MKPHLIISRIVAFLGLMVITFNGYCQSPQTFPLSGNNPVWKETSRHYQNSNYLIFCLHSDTLINSNLFQKIFIVEDTIYNETVSHYYGAIREDEGKIYIVYRNKETQNLLYDFSANETDTIWMKSIYKCRDFEKYINYVVVESIDSININGNIHRVFNVTDGGDRGYWIEGIGNDGEIFCPLTIATDDGFYGSEITCFKRDEKIYYPDSTSNCFRFTGIAGQVNEENPFSVSPNPSSSIFEIKSNSSYRIAKVNVINLCGSVVRTFDVNKESEAQIALNGLTSGSYFIEVETTSNKRFFSKIIKQ